MFAISFVVIGLLLSFFIGHALGVAKGWEDACDYQDEIDREQ
jgi:hypothetical protein